MQIFCGANTLYFEAEYDHHYTYSSQSDILGMHNVTTVIKFRIRAVNETSTGQSLNLLKVDSFVQHTENGYVADNPGHWYFDHNFYFVVGTDGIITLVHYHPDEVDEVLTMKKVLASTLSANVQIGDGDVWEYSSSEEDHAGHLDHEYTGERNPDGFRLTRSHQSSHNVHRSHNKTLQYDHRGTPMQVDSLDNVTLRHAPSKITRTSIEGVQDIEDEQTGEFPKIASISRTQVKLVVKSKHSEPTSHSMYDLHNDTITVKEKQQEKKYLLDINKDIEHYLDCANSISNKFDRNRTDCVHNLRNLIHSLHKEDLLKLSYESLTRQCNINDTICTDQRNLMIDIIAREGSNESQLLLLDLVMRQPNVTEEDLRRCLFHSIALSSPHLELVQHIEEICFGNDVQSGETPTLTKNRKRACLSLGALAKSLHHQNLTESERIVERIENWLEHHNETKSMKIVKPRKRRSLIQHDTRARKHIETKLVLIQALGNAGKNRSIKHIKSYMKPNVGVTAWRRAAIHSLRHFSCHESAHALVTSVVHDDDDIVRKTALNVLKSHPKRENLTVEHENVVLSKNYSYPVVARVRRGLLQALEQGIRVYIEPPGIEWDKTIGNSQIGASFGLHIRNVLDLKLALLSGHFIVDVYDGAYAEAHVGLIGYKVDIVKAFVCFKGYIKYDLNVLKDFGINSLSDIVHIYDKIVAKIITPIINAVKAFKDIVIFFKDGRGLQKIINTIVQTVKNLPVILGDVAKRLQEFVKEIFSIAGSTILEEIKVIVSHVRGFVDGVKQDILKFYNDIVDAVTIALPFISKKIVEAFNLIVSAIKSLLDNPMQAITAMSRGITDIKMAITMAIDVKNKIVEACLFVKGRAVEWMNTAKQIPSILKRLADAFKTLVSSIRRRRDLESDMTNIFSDGIGNMKNSVQNLEEDLKKKWDEVFAPLKPLIDIVKPFIDEFKAIMDLIQGLKWGYEEVKKAIETGKSLVQKVFGPKFHLKFPTERRAADDNCKVGVWPTTTDGQYQTTGVDLALGEKQSIAMPVNGILHVQNDNKVIVQPTDPEFLLMEIVIENINPDYGLNGMQVKSGDKIGKASRAPKCQANFIHVSVRQAEAHTLPSEADYEYTDPSPFLDRLVPVPKWIQECNDHEFRYIGQTFESGESAEDDDPKAQSANVERDKENERDISEELDHRFGEEDTTYRPDDPALYDPQSFQDSLKESLKEQAKKFSNFFKTALFGSKGPEVPNILEIVNLNGKTVDWILSKLSASSKLYNDLKAVIDKLSSCMTKLPVGNPGALSLSFVQKTLQLHNISGTMKFMPGDLAKVTDKLLLMAEKAVPSFKGAISIGFGHICTAHNYGLGITCSVPIPVKSQIKYIIFNVVAYPSELKIAVDVEYNGFKKQLEIQATGTDIKWDTSIEFLGIKVYLLANLDIVNGSIVLDAEIKACSQNFIVCLPSIELFHKIKFLPGVSRHKRAMALAQIPAILGLSIPDFIGKLGECQLLEKEITKVVEDVRETVVQELLSSAVDKLVDIVKEFKDKVDFCISANIPVPPYDITFFNVRYHFLVGPVPLSLGFGAGGAVGLGVRVGLCVLSMTTQLTLTPWVGGKVWGDAAVDIFIARGGIRLIGYLLETKFPMTTELVFSKYPIDVGAKMDLVLKPLRLQLKAFAELIIPLIFKTIRVTVFEGNLWEYTAPTITQNIFTKKKRDDDPSPPDVMPLTINERKKRAGARGCDVRQIVGRAHYDPAFRLEMHAQDEVSEVKLFYAIGTYSGGTNVVDWTTMGGNTLMVPAKLPSGIPLYWTVKARNSQGLESTVQCSLDTFDSTLPDGRVQHAYKYQSHPNRLIASVVAFEDSPLADTHYKAVGFSPGQFGSQFVDWQSLTIDHSAVREGVSGVLKTFTVPREGKLVADILKSLKMSSPEGCAQQCLNMGKQCVSFDYEYHSETCDLHDVIEGTNAYLRISGTYSNYERLTTGYHTPTEYTNLPLAHGVTYFVNVKLTNVLGYSAYLIGEGTLVDFTPPEPGLIRNSLQDILRADNCTAAITQKCIDVTWKQNHRIIIDGAGSGTVFNGHKPLLDELYTLTNHFVSANWKGFHDDESDIWGYTWAVGRHVCGTDVIAFEDPYAHLTNKMFWTDSAFHKDIHLEDGAYYVTVQALNGAELGGSLVTTVCHSTPFIVDTSPPLFHGVTDIIYDEDFDLIAIYYNATDDLSKIANAEFGLGKTKYDVQLKPYGLHASMDRSDPFVAVEDLGLQEGIPAWLRIRVTNNVDLFTAGHGDEPILIDKSPPIAGHVLDGNRFRQDKMFQSDSNKICAQWVDFYDPESGIDRFLWGVGRLPGRDDIVKFHNLTRYDKSSCAPATLLHNQSYFSTVFSYNNALNSKSANSSSDGVLVDTTSPISGVVFDGLEGKRELKYSSETVSKFANWKGFSDPESGIDRYKVDVFINNDLKNTFDVGRQTKFDDHTISMGHTDKIYFTVHGINGADLEVTAQSDGFNVDLTPPILTEISGSEQGVAYQNQKEELRLAWEFRDSESGIEEYRTIIYETKYGIKQKFWPTNDNFNSSKPLSPYVTKTEVTLSNLNMNDGALYTLHVTAINGALLSTAHETDGVTIDTTAPSAPGVHIGLPKDEENIDENGNVLHSDQKGIRASWSGRDSESDIKSFLVAVGTATEPESILPFTDYGKETTAYIQNIQLETSSENNKLYVISVKAINGAGLVSSPGKSRSIFIQKANVPGIVFDGRTLYEDEMYTTDHTSIAASFYGFSSESCNIISYEWAIGTTEYGTDVLFYTNYGVVMNNDTHGQCQIHTELFEDTKYYITIRAVTGCQEEYILSSSDGITLDRKAPDVIYDLAAGINTETYKRRDVLYQATTDTLPLQTNVSDTNSISYVRWGLGTLPLLDDRHPYTDDFSKLTSVVVLIPGETVFITANTSDKAGNVNVTSSMAIVADITAPFIDGLDCTVSLSVRKSLLTCTWKTVVENESLLKEMSLQIGSNSNSTDILDHYLLPRGFNSFSRDLIQHIKDMPYTTSIFVNIHVENVIGQKKSYGRQVIVDRTTPLVERLDVVTSIGKEAIEEHQRCQLPRSYVELKLVGVTDEESDIDTSRFEASIGFKPFGTEVVNYVPVTQNSKNIFFIDGLSLQVGVMFYATVRIYNKAGLKTDVTSESVVISQAPYLEVIDGDGEEDVDYQSAPNIIQGRWRYSDLCPIKEASWSIEDLTGKVLFDFHPIPNAARIIYNDEVALENGMKYIITVKTVDFLDRIKIARSDGVSVRIQPPFPGRVRDGENEDQNYQFSTTDLSANWDSFGDNSKDPTQSIHHYEVAIGNDRRYQKTRSNVHYFVNVGLNNSYTFKNLNLTSKLVRYYITVRSYSMAGGYTEGYSNGIRVGFDDDIVAGTLNLNKYQSLTNTISVSWSGFRSDIAIIDYKVAISSDNVITNDTLKCVDFLRNASLYDVSKLHSVGLNEYVQIDGLDLKHGHFYFITVVAEDEAGMCTGVTSEPILVDTTAPEIGDLLINNILSKSVMYATDNKEIHIGWKNFVDSESGVIQTVIRLYECSSCLKAQNDVAKDKCYSIAENIMKDDTGTSFYELQLDATKAYYVTIDVMNGARKVAHAQSATILLDVTEPYVGRVKIAKDWFSSSTYQKSITDIDGLLAIADTFADYICPTQLTYFPTTGSTSWRQLTEEFSNDFVTINKSGACLGIGFNSDLTDIIKSSINSERLKLEKGNYSFSVTVAKGLKVITSVSMLTHPSVIPFTIDNKPIEEIFDYSRFENITGLAAPGNESHVMNTTEEAVKKKPGSFVSTNGTAGSPTYIDKEEYGFGIHFLGYRIYNNTKWHHVFWARNKFTNIERWFQLGFDPTVGIHKYTVLVEKKSEYLETTVDLTLIIDEQELVSISGFKFPGDTKIAAFTWTEENYKPPIDDIYRPFYSDAVVHQIDIPDNSDTLCRHGRGFYDGESGIKELWLGVSDNNIEFGNIAPFKLFKSFCYPCRQPCMDLCKEPCSDQTLTDRFTLVPLNVKDLNLGAGDLNDICHNVTSEVKCNSTAYYLNVKVINYAGKESLAYSNPILIDVTPPECEYVKCLDPEYSEDEPTIHVGSSSQIGAYWNCTEAESQIEYYLVRVVSENGFVIMNSTNVGRISKVKFSLKNGSLEDGKDYRVEVETINTAGLSYAKSCSVHVSLYPPDNTATLTAPLYIDEVASQSEDGTTYWTSSQTSVGITWDGGSNETEFYEWKIGTQDDTYDIFPPIKVGQDPHGSTAIVHGQLILNNMYVNRTVVEFKNTTNMSPEEIQNLKEANDREKSFFNMEPGRCIHQSLHAIGYSHLKSKVRGNVVCIKRIADSYINATANRVLVSKPLKSAKWEKGRVLYPELSVDAQLVSGGVTVGTLTNEDKTSDYGTAATADYVPFISDITSTGDRLSRILRHRVQKTCNISFYLSPTPTAEFDEFLVNITLPSNCTSDGNYQPALIYWDNENNEWVHVEEECLDHLSANINNIDYYVVQLCKTAAHDQNKQKRATTSTLTKPRAFEVVRISTSFQNTPPTIITTTIYLVEDTNIEVTIETIDLENDKLMHEITEQPSNMICEVKTTKLNCTLTANFYGVDYIKIRVTETGLPASGQALTTEKQITLIVTAVPDKTERYFLDNNGTIHGSKHPTLSHIVNVEANVSSSYFAGTLILADVDGNEMFTERTRFTALANSTFTLSKAEISISLLENYTLTIYKSVQAYTIVLQYSEKIKGNMTLEFIANTADNSFTPSFTLTVYVLENPCVYGHCSHRLYGDAACKDISRSQSFSSYYCVCNAGYTDEWCQTEINECAPEPCTLMYDCEDLVNDYKCNINVLKLLAILFCSLIAIGVFVFILVKLIKRYKINKVSQSSINLTETPYINETYVISEEEEQDGNELMRPMSSASILLEPASSSGPAIPPDTYKKMFYSKWFENSEVDLRNVFAAPGTTLPPHHHFKTFKPASGTDNVESKKMSAKQLEVTINKQERVYNGDKPPSPSNKTPSPTPFDQLCLELRETEQSRSSSRMTDIDV